MGRLVGRVVGGMLLGFLVGEYDGELVIAGLRGVGIWVGFVVVGVLVGRDVGKAVGAVGCDVGKTGTTFEVDEAALWLEAALISGERTC